jgi:hypothetical protein
MAQFGWVDRLDEALQASTYCINLGDHKGRTLAYRAATHPINGHENPCLDVLIDDYHVEFLTQNEAIITPREKLYLAIECVVFAAGLGYGVYIYLSKHATESCDTAYNGMLLVPYLFTFVSVIVFKVVQFLFQETMTQALDFFVFMSGLDKAVGAIFTCIFSIFTCSNKNSKTKVTPSSKERDEEVELPLCIQGRSRLRW